MSSHGRLRAAIQLILGVLLFFAVDNLVFGTSIYSRWVDPQSTLGNVQLALDNPGHVPTGASTIFVVGDSRITEGFSATIANDVSAEANAHVTFVNAGLAGSTPRVWFYLLREMGLRAHHVTKVAIMLASMHDDETEALANRDLDDAYLHSILRLSDSIDFPASFETYAGRQRAAQAIWLRGFFFKADLQAFLQHPFARLRNVRAWREHGYDWTSAYPGRDISLDGLARDPQRGTLTVSAPLTTPIAPTLKEYADDLQQFDGRHPENDGARRYRELWLGRIAALCRDAGARLVIFRIPRGPLHYTVDADATPSGVVAELAKADAIDLVPADRFNHLEQPQFFFDNLHMNSAGRNIFSAKLAALLIR